MKRETIIGTWVVGLALLLLSFALDWPWWGQTFDYTSSSGSTSVSYSTNLIETSISKGSWELLMGYLVLLFLIVSFIGGLLFLVHLFFLVAKKKFVKKSDRLAIVTNLFLIFAIVIYAGVLPAAKFQDAKAEAIQKDGEFVEPDGPAPLNSFWGSSTNDSGDTSWGPEIGFVMACAAFIILFSAHILFAFHREKASKIVR